MSSFIYAVTGQGSHEPPSHQADQQKILKRVGLDYLARLPLNCVRRNFINGESCWLLVPKLDGPEAEEAKPQIKEGEQNWQQYDDVLWVGCWTGNEHMMLRYPKPVEFLKPGTRIGSEITFANGMKFLVPAVPLSFPTKSKYDWESKKFKDVHVGGYEHLFGKVERYWNAFVKARPLEEEKEKVLEKVREQEEVIKKADDLSNEEKQKVIDDSNSVYEELELIQDKIDKIYPSFEEQVQDLVELLQVNYYIGLYELDLIEAIDKPTVNVAVLGALLDYRAQQEQKGNEKKS